MLLLQSIRRSAAFRPSAIATIDGAAQQTWSEVVDRVARAADGLRQLGVRSGDRVGILALNSARYFEAQLATWWLGAVLVPMNIRWSVEENIYSIHDADITTLIFDGAFADTASAIFRKVPNMRGIVLDVEPRDNWYVYDELIVRGQPTEAANTPIDSLAGIYYTGGTTGFPKGVMLSHLALWSSAMAIAVATGINKESRMLHATPMFHLADGSLSHSAMIVGATHVFVPRFEPKAVVGVIEQSSITDILLVPTMIGMLQNCDVYSPERLASVRTLSFGASPIPDPILMNLQSDLPDVQLLHVYGQTEMGPTISYLESKYQKPGHPKAQSVGQPFACVELKIVDEDGAEVPANVAGEILARGPGAMTGYWKRPEETAKAIIDGWVRTGDVAYKDHEGFLFICDRVKDMVITGGENVFSAEVENAVASHPAVMQVAVIGIPDAQFGESVHAVIVPKPGQTVTAEEIKEHCSVRIANYKCPRSIELRDSLPTSGAGKVLKRELREPYWQGQRRAVH